MGDAGEIRFARRFLATADWGGLGDWRIPSGEEVEDAIEPAEDFALGGVGDLDAFSSEFSSIVSGMESPAGLAANGCVASGPPPPGSPSSSRSGSSENWLCACSFLALTRSFL